MDLIIILKFACFIYFTIVVFRIVKLKAGDRVTDLVRMVEVEEVVEANGE